MLLCCLSRETTSNMKKHSSKVKKSRRQTRLKTLRNRDDETDAVKEASVKNARIKSAIEKGIESLLPSDTTTGHCLKKFEHKGKEGPLVVYAEDRKVFDEYGHFTVITSFKPSDSLRNQLFFGERSSLSGIVSDTRHEILQNMDVNDLQDNQQVNKNIHQKDPKDNSEMSARQRRHQAKSFEGLVVRYKNRQEKYKRLLGNDTMYLFQEIDNLCSTDGNSMTRKHDIAGNIKPVLPRITVDKTDDDNAMFIEKASTSDSKRHSRRKREHLLPHLTVSRYGTI